MALYKTGNSKYEKVNKLRVNELLYALDPSSSPRKNKTAPSLIHLHR